MCITTQFAEKYTFYAQFHQNFWNKLIHFFCIPSIVFTLFVMLNYIPIHFSYFDECIYTIRFSVFLYACYALYHFYLSCIIGLIANIFYGIILFLANVFYCRIEGAYIYAIALHVFSWVFQILGHKYCEGGRPAFVTGFKDSFLVAPLFVVFELLPKQKHNMEEYVKVNEEIV